VATPEPGEDMYPPPMVLAVRKGEGMLMSGRINERGMANNK
jgi:hypothetical protein